MSVRSQKKPFRLRRALEKQPSLTRQIDILLAFANSPRLRPMLQYPMALVTVPRSTRRVHLASHPQEWQAILGATSLEQEDSQGNVAHELLQWYSKEAYQCIVHCECKLLWHLQKNHGDSWDTVQPFSYLGVSKLSCSTCRIWVETWNKLGGRQFHTHGSHAKWYWPWGMPVTEHAPDGRGIEQRLKSEIISTIRDVYATYIQSTRRLSLHSDSTTPPFTGAEYLLSKLEIHGAVSRLRVWKQKFRWHTSEALKSWRINGTHGWRNSKKGAW
ncbi:hypothetical protein HOY80DRAFT_1006166 [Tuber brumale]|nr:hypothetical protein HOY80DRAFT_1006166 [Tuber brumale]